MSAPVVALCTDGAEITIRPLTDADRGSVLAMVDRLSDNSVYLRFFSSSREAARRYYGSLPGSNDHRINLVALSDGQVVGIAGYELNDSQTAELALVVDERWQGDGIGTLLVEHVLSRARALGVTQVVAEVLSKNVAMLALLRDLGYSRSVSWAAGQAHQVFSLGAPESALAAVDEREAVADVASLTPLLRPNSLAVVGASDHPRSVGSGLMASIAAAGFTGRVYPVNPTHQTIAGLPAYASVAKLPEPVRPSRDCGAG